MKRKALICIDMQNDFLLPTSPLCVAGGLTCLPHVKDAIAAAHAHADTLGGVQVIYVVRSHCPSGSFRVCACRKTTCSHCAIARSLDVLAEPMRVQGMMSSTHGLLYSVTESAS